MNQRLCTFWLYGNVCALLCYFLFVHFVCHLSFRFLQYMLHCIMYFICLGNATTTIIIALVSVVITFTIVACSIGTCIICFHRYRKKSAENSQVHVSREEGAHICVTHILILLLITSHLKLVLKFYVLLKVGKECFTWFMAWGMSSHCPNSTRLCLLLYGQQDHSPSAISHVRHNLHTLSGFKCNVWVTYECWALNSVR